MKAIGYIRVSTSGQVEDGVSLDAQEAKVRSWADLNNAAEVVIFRDEGISGKRSDNRPGLQSALAMVGKGDALVVYSLSRLSRSTKDALVLSEILLKKEADLVSLSEKIDTTSASGKMVFRLMAVLNEFERDQISDRTRFALAHKKAIGEKTGGDIPFGYYLDGGRLVEDNNEQKAIILIRDLRSKGYRLQAICWELEKEGYLTRRGNLKWQPKTVSRIIERLAA
ncbi:MAG: recombinase family protein [Candidatus Omnitrophota bacterium]|nr:recombinase family protein [Candidatus Omnitrophota bacterium]